MYVCTFVVEVAVWIFFILLIACPQLHQSHSKNVIVHVRVFWKEYSRILFFNKQ